MKKQTLTVMLGTMIGSITIVQAANFSAQALEQAAVAYNKPNGALAAMQQLEQQDNGFVPLMLNKCFQIGEVGCPQDAKKAQISTSQKNEIQQQLQRLADNNQAEAYYWLGKTQQGTKENVISWYQKAANLNYAPAINNLGRIYQENLKDDVQALEYYQKAADLGDVNAMHNLAVMYYTGTGIAYDYSKAFEWFEKAANLNHTKAMNGLADMYKDGSGVFRDYSQALTWYLKAASLGDFTSMIKIGQMYQMGQGVPTSSLKAFQWYKKSAEVEKDYKQGKSFNAANYKFPDMIQIATNTATPKNIIHVQTKDFSVHAIKQAAAAYQQMNGALAAMQLLEQQANGFVPLMLSDCFKYGNAGCPQDEKKAKVYESQKSEIQQQLQRLIENNDQPEVYYWLGYSQSTDELAIPWYQKAAALDYAPAFNKLGRIYSNRNNKMQAVEYYQKAANLGDASAMINMAVMYRNGEGVTQDYIKAIVWYEKAADLGSTEAMNGLGYMYYKGLGVEQDYQQARVWYQKSADLGYATSMDWLGWLYEHGEGVPEDKNQAIAWYTKAKDLGSLSAKGNLSRVDPSMLAIAGKGLGKGVVGGVKIVGSILGGVVDILADPALSNALQQQTASMQRDFDRQRRQEIEAKAFSARLAEERRQANAANAYRSSSYSSSSSSKSSSSGSSSSYSASSTSKSSGSSSSSSGGNSNIGEINKKYQTEREKNLKVQEQKKLEQQKAYEAKLAKEQKEREEEERQREIQLANEKREREQQAEKERKEREQLAQKHREELAKANYLMKLQYGIKLKARSCYGGNYVVGTRPKISPQLVSGINVHYRAYCSGGGSYSGISKNFIGMGTDCFTGDTTGNEIPKSVLSCKAEDMTVEVTNVTSTR